MGRWQAQRLRRPGDDLAVDEGAIQQAALAAVLELAKEKVVTLKDAVAITKTEKGKIKLHQTKDDPAGKGFLKGGVIGIVLAVLFGAVGWVAVGALMGTAFALFDRGIKNKLLKELGEKMTTDKSSPTRRLRARPGAASITDRR